MNKGAARIKVNCTLNGKKHELDCHPMARLLDVIRDEARLTGTKEGCGEGECGACSVLVDGEIVNSCLIPAIQAEGANIVTIEGIGSGIDARAETGLHRVQEAFLECGGAQCGICTPGMIIAAVSLLEKNPEPTEQDVRAALAGNLCRCTGYTRIFESVLRAAKEARG